MDIKQLKKLIRESFRTLLEVELTTDKKAGIEDINQAGTRFAKSGINTEFFNSIIQKILNGDLTKWTLDFAYAKGKVKELGYILSTLATLYKEVDGTQKENIRDYIFYSLVPKGNRSSFLTLIGKKAGIADIFEKSKDDEVYDLLLDSVGEAIPKALETFNPEMNRDFFAYVILLCTNITKNNLKKWYGYSEDDETKYVTKSSLDDPMHDDNDETKASALPSVEKSENSEIKAMAEAVDDFIRDELFHGKNPLWMNIYDMTTAGYNIEQMADALKQDPRQIRTTRSRMSDIIDAAIKKGELADYVFKQTGLDINKFPKVQEILKGGKFIFTNPAKIIKEAFEKIAKERLMLNENLRNVIPGLIK
jgi:hypothetical protein